MIGSEWLDNIEELAESHRKFEAERGDGGWALSEFFVVGWDGSGAPYGFDLRNGSIVSEATGVVTMLAPTFFDLLVAGGLVKL